MRIIIGEKGMKNLHFTAGPNRHIIHQRFRISSGHRKRAIINRTGEGLNGS
jgi:hypothetical protein